MRSVGVLIACAGVFLNLTAAYGLPKRIIILRHAEKIETGGLCTVGEKRANALATQYLGKGAKDSLFANGEQPAAFYANTGHAKKTIEPAFEKWKDIKLHDRKNTVYKCDKTDKEKCDNTNIDQWSINAAEDVLANYDNKIVVMAWEHHRIADENLDNEPAYVKDPVTLYRRLGIYNYPNQIVDDVGLSNWCGSNYDYFWIVEYNPTDKYAKGHPPTPTNIMVKLQALQGLPQNPWGSPAPDGVFKRPDGTGGECDATPKPLCPAPLSPPKH
jgi:hypothetical protein